jgi:hypothetical protein
MRHRRANEEYTVILRPTTRRDAIVGVVASVGILSLGSIRWVAAQSESPKPPPAPQGDAGFLDLSQKLTGHFDLDPQTAARVSAGFARIDPALFARMTALIPLARTNQDPTALMKAAQAVGLDDAAQALTAAWYTGTVGSGPKAEVVAYADALMYWPVRDAMAPPTYCLAGPASWVQPPPPVGVSPPVSAAPAPVAGPPESKAQ